MTLQDEFAVGDAAMAYLKAKADEDAAKARREQAAETLTSLVGNDTVEGTRTVEAEGYKVSVTRKLTRTLDQDEVARLIGDLPDEQSAVQTRYTLSLTGLRAMMEYHPEAVAILNRAITTKPARAAVKVTEVKE